MKDLEAYIDEAIKNIRSDRAITMTLLIELMDYIKALETSLGMVAKKELLPIQPGDVPDTFADIDDLEEEFGYKPTMSIENGVENFVQWYKEYNKIY